MLFSTSKNYRQLPKKEAQMEPKWSRKWSQNRRNAEETLDVIFERRFSLFFLQNAFGDHHKNIKIVWKGHQFRGFRLVRWSWTRHPQNIQKSTENQPKISQNPYPNALQNHSPNRSAKNMRKITKNDSISFYFIEWNFFNGYH